MYCGKCGNELTKIDKFCPKCGKAVNNEIITDTNTISNHNNTKVIKTPNVKIIGIVVLVIFIILIGISLHSNISNIRKDTQKEITGIEQAIKDGMIGTDYLTKGVSESQLYFTFTDGNLQMYYDSWEDCLADAKQLNIITSNEEYLTMEEVLDKENGIK